jgi:protein phosphatase
MSEPARNTAAEGAARAAMAWAGVTDRGLVRENNEDAFIVVGMTEAGRSVRLADAAAAPEVGAAGTLFIVSDGVGGGNAGEVASAMAVSVVPEALAALGLTPAAASNRGCAEALETAIRHANGRIRQEAAADADRTGMAATLSALWLLQDRAIIGQVGDSRIYRLRADRLVQLTHDQSEVGRMVRAGEITEEESKTFRGRNIIDQSLGMRDDLFEPDLDWVETMPGDLYLLCSDGLVDRLENRHLAEILTGARRKGMSLAETAAKLVEEANRTSGRDNCTVLLVELAGAAAPAVTAAPPPPLPAPAVPPAAPQAVQVQRGGARGALGRSMAAAAVGVVAGALAIWVFVAWPAQASGRRRAEAASAQAGVLRRELQALEARAAETLAQRNERAAGLEREWKRAETERAAAIEALGLAREFTAECERRIGVLEAALDKARTDAVAAERDAAAKVAAAEARAVEAEAAARRAAGGAGPANGTGEPRVPAVDPAPAP